MQRFAPIGRDDGFTLAELIISIAILMVVITAAMSAMVFAVATGKTTQERGRAVNLANQRLEQARDLPYDSVGVTYANGTHGEPPGSILTPQAVDEFTVTTQVTWARDASTGRATYKKIKVTVSWARPSPGSLSLSSNIFGSSAIANSGDVEVRVLDSDSAAPIEGASVSVAPASGFPRWAQTEADGVAMFGYLPTGAINVSASAMGYLIDTSGVQGASVANDSLTRLTVYAQRPSSGTVKVVDGAGVAVSGATVKITPQSGGALTGTTGSDGLVTFGDLLKGSYSVAVTASGYGDGTGSFVISLGNQSVQTQVTLAQLSTLNVHVTDASGVAISGATVTVTGPSPSSASAPGSPGVTSSGGDAGFPVGTAGTYTVTASKTGYSTASTTALVSGPSTSVTVALGAAPTGTGTLTIYTVNSRGNAIGRRRVTVSGAAGTYTTTITTDNNGQYTLTNLVPGEYTVTTTRDSKTAQVQSGGTSIVSVRAQ